MIKSARNLSKVSSPIRIGFGLLIFTALTVTFVFSPLEPADDWEVFYGAAQRVVHHQPLYGIDVKSTYYYYNPPWLAVGLTPLTLLPARWGWAIISVSSLIVAILLVNRWDKSLWKIVPVLLSPPMLYTILHGQIDVLITGAILLPDSWWLVVGFIKPQVGSGIIFGIAKKYQMQALIITGIIAGASFLWFGWWIPSMLQQPPPPVDGHNVWGGLWPFQFPIGLALVFWGFQKKDERFFLASSPFFFPYAATSSLFGGWVVVNSLLNKWQSTVVFLAWWGAVAYRAIVMQAF